MYASYKCSICTFLFVIHVRYVTCEDDANETIVDLANEYNWKRISHKYPEVHHLASISFLKYANGNLDGEINKDNSDVSVISAQRDTSKLLYRINYHGHRKLGCDITGICRNAKDLICETEVALGNDVNNPINIKSTVCKNDESSNVKSTSRKWKRDVDLEANTSIDNHHMIFLANFAISKYAAMIDEDITAFRDIKILSENKNHNYFTHDFSAAVQICFSPLLPRCLRIGHVVCDTIIQERFDIFRPFSVLKLSCSHVSGKNWMATKFETDDKLLRNRFDKFIKTYNKPYKRDRRIEYRFLEYEYRLQVFSRNMKYVTYLNDQEKGTAEYGVTQFADIPRFEFKYRYLGLDAPVGRIMVVPNAFIPDVNTPESFDWRTKGMVTGIKDQGECGGCWAFSTIANIESLWMMKTGKLLNFSEQYLMDCDNMDNGCEGGMMDTAYLGIMQLGGVVLEDQYPYTGKPDKCNSKIPRVANITGGVLLSRDEEDMKKYLYMNGPVSAALNGKIAQFYLKGVSRPAYGTCPAYQLNHAMLIVGYGVERRGKYKMPYWILKNSWGRVFGEDGYYRLYRGEGSCGINSHVTSAIV